PDGATVFEVALGGGKLEEFDVATGDRSGSIRAESVGVSAFVGAPSATLDGRYIDILTTSGVARFEADTLRLVRAVDVGDAGRGNVAQIPGTDDVLAPGAVGRIYRLGMTTGEIVGIARSLDTSSINGVAVSADGTMIAARHPFTSQVALFDALTLRPI